MDNRAAKLKAMIQQYRDLQETYNGIEADVDPEYRDGAYEEIQHDTDVLGEEIYKMGGSVL